MRANLKRMTVITARALALPAGQTFRFKDGMRGAVNG
jgi:hypothetical protein